MAIVIKPSKALSRLVLPDAILANARNRAATRAAIPAMLANRITAAQHEGRPFFHFWGGQVTYDDQGVNPALRVLHLNTLEGGCKHRRGIINAFPQAGATSPTAGITAFGQLNSLTASAFSVRYPDNLVQPHVSPETPGAETTVPTGEADEVNIGTDSIIMAGGCLLEDTVLDADPDLVVMPSAFAPGADILAFQTNNNSTNERLVERFEHVWQNRRPQIGWSAIEGTYCDFTESPQDFRYWGNQAVGDGGDAPSLTGPAITLHARAAGAGLRETVRVYPWVYAAMSGGTDQGEIAIANRAPDGSMGPMVQIGGAGMISGTGYLWYPAVGGAFDPTSMYFETPANLAIDRICLGARSTGATDTVRIGAWMMAIYHSTA